MPQAADQLFIAGKLEDQGFSGVPVRRMFTVAGRQTTSELTEAMPSRAREVSARR